MIENELKQDLLNPKQAAAFITMEPQTLAIWRCTKRYDLPYIRVGRLIRYRRADLEKFLASRTVEAKAPA